VRLTKHLANLTASQCAAADTNCPRRQRTEHSMAACPGAHSLGRRHELVGRAGHCCLGPAKREIVRRLESLYFVQLAEQSIRRLLTEYGAQLADRIAVRVGELGLRPKFVAAADEMVERRLDMGEANIFEAARGANAKLRFLAGCFITRYSTKAWRRGWLTNAPPDKEVATEPQNITIRWANPDGTLAPPQPTEQVMRDGKLIELPTYDRVATAVDTASPSAGDDALNVLAGEALPEAHGHFHVGIGEDIDPANEAPVLIEASPAVQSTPSPPALPIWPGPGGPPPLVANKFRPWTPPQPKAQPRRERELALEPEEPPPRASVYRPSRGGWR
jgi:hypothetical protein